MKTINKDTVIVSMTTYPARAASAITAMSSLLLQITSDMNVHPVLVLAEDEWPNKILPIEFNTLLPTTEILWTKDNLKAYNKFLPVMEKYPDNAVITFDDDKYYSYSLIENFIYDSNPEAIRKTEKNIALVGQREPGVTLADGRIVDGNRRYTCLRRIQRTTSEPVYFETVLMDMDIREDKKKIKLLELAIQHGEEKKVDYDLIDFAIGTYRDVVQTKLLTIKEYATSTNEQPADVKKRIEIAEVICEFLEYIGLSEQYHVAREYQVYSLFQEMIPLLRSLEETEKTKLKRISFNNVLMKAIPDQRKFIRDIKALIRGDSYRNYFEDQRKWDDVIHEKLHGKKIHTKEDIDAFALENSDIADELAMSMERAMLRSRSKKLKEKPSENVAKSIALMMDIDTRFFDRLGTEEKESLKAELGELIRIAERFKELL